MKQEIGSQNIAVKKLIIRRDFIKAKSQSESKQRISGAGDGNIGYNECSMVAQNVHKLRHGRIGKRLY